MKRELGEREGLEHQSLNHLSQAKQTLALFKAHQERYLAELKSYHNAQARLSQLSEQQAVLALSLSQAQSQLQTEEHNLNEARGRRTPAHRSARKRLSQLKKDP
ncbi:MAG: hypothetical protein R2865_12880 [Deinococcales bacterium]